MDPFIEQYADDQRAQARQMLDWQLDRLRLDLGMVEVVPPERGPILRTLRRTKRERLLEPEDRDTRLLPFFDGTGVWIRDK